MLTRGLIPPECVKPEDFSLEINRRAVQWFIEGKNVNTFIESIEDAVQRNVLMEALNYTPLPDNADDALEFAQSALETMRRDRINAKMREITERLSDASPEERKNLYAQLEAIRKGLSD